MRGSVDWQVRAVFESINHIGESKHEAKIAAGEAGAKTWHEKGKALGNYGYKTHDDYRAVGKQMFAAVRQEYGIKDLTKIEPAHVQGWLADKITSGDWARATSDKYMAAIEKLESALNKYCAEKGVEKSFNFDLKVVRYLAVKVLGARSDESRAYADPKALIGALKNEDFQLVARMQLEGGPRINEATQVFEHQMKGLRPDPHTGEMKGHIEKICKGGKINEYRMKAETYERLAKTIEAKGVIKIEKLCGTAKNPVSGKMMGWAQRPGEAKPFAMDLKAYAKLEKTFVPGSRCFEVPGKAYNAALKIAAKATNQKYNASHGVRWNYCQNRHTELQTVAKLTFDQALSIISNEVSHERSDITCHYLK